MPVRRCSKNSTIRRRYLLRSSSHVAHQDIESDQLNNPTNVHPTSSQEVAGQLLNNDLSNSEEAECPKTPRPRPRELPDVSEESHSIPWSSPPRSDMPLYETVPDESGGFFSRSVRYPGKIEEGLALVIGPTGPDEDDEEEESGTEETFRTPTSSQAFDFIRSPAPSPSPTRNEQNQAYADRCSSSKRLYEEEEQQHGSFSSWYASTCPPVPWESGLSPLRDEDL
ncbi:hypothetical protein L218DRAFT_965987 [Marasmius fiardii PR-910]|nr:hypothetical protein L218DRAFT_965987 [Marasmius fiardii PR-910]